MANKLKDKQGVTMLMALLLLLIAMMVSAVVLAAATTAVKTMNDDRGQQQAYLNVSSAAKLLEKELESFNQSPMRLGLKTTETGTGTNIQTTKETIKAVPATLLEDIWERFVRENGTNGGAEFALPAGNGISFTVEAPHMGKVNARFTIWEDPLRDDVYIAQIELRNADENYPCTLYMHMTLTGAADNKDYDVGEGSNKAHVKEEAKRYTWDAVSVDKKEEKPK